MNQTESRPAWVIETDYLYRPGDSSIPDESGVGMGDHEADDVNIPFRVYDSDDILYYSGRMNLKALDAFGDSDPLYAFAMGNAGATRLDARINGKWQTI